MAKRSMSRCPGADLAQSWRGAWVSSPYLAELALEILARALNGGEDALIKVFEGTAFGSSFGTCGRFAKVKLVKSAALRACSTEMYLLAKDFSLV